MLITWKKFYETFESPDSQPKVKFAHLPKNLEALKLDKSQRRLAKIETLVQSAQRQTRKQK